MGLIKGIQCGTQSAVWRVPVADVTIGTQNLGTRGINGLRVGGLGGDIGGDIGGL